MRKKVGLIPANGLGDGVLWAVLANNLNQAGYESVLFSSPLMGLKKWFPHLTIRPFLTVAEIALLPGEFDHLVVDSASYLANPKNPKFIEDVRKLKSWQPKLAIPTWNSRQYRLDNLLAFFEENFDIRPQLREAGITPPQPLHHRCHHQRVIIHSTSSDIHRNWSAVGFINLATRLKEMGFDPVFVMSSDERANWQTLIDQHHLHCPQIKTLGELATLIYQSGWMIGNDSGVGHLASCLGIPTLTIFKRKKDSRVWRPCWAPSEMVLPWPLPKWLVKRGFWRYTISVRRVFYAFIKLTCYNDEA